MAFNHLKRRTSRRMMSEINVVPYIDVMLVLVVILMVAAPFVNPSVVNLPSIQKAAAAPQQVVEVVVHPDGKISIKDHNKLRPADISSLVRGVQSAQAGADTPVVISADKDVIYEQVVNVMKALQKADIHRIGLSMQIEHGRK